MKRVRKYRTPDMILCSDFHLREDTPTCWIGNFQEEQWSSIVFIRELQKNYGCVVIHAGDLFHHWKPSPWLLSQAMLYLPDNFYTVYGQHDLPQHNWELRGKSGIKTLEMARRLTVLNGCHWGQKPDDWVNSFVVGLKNILVWHHMTYITPPYPGASGGQAQSILKKYPQFDLIVTGDNHDSFTTEYNGCRLVNPGNLTRQTADQIDYQPRVALWYADTNTIQWVYIPIKEGVITREHIEKVQQRDARLEAFITTLKDEWEVGISFEQNLESFFKKNKIDASTKTLIYKALENEKR